eukprot:1716712-Amphidinium_carterae.2
MKRRVVNQFMLPIGRLSVWHDLNGSAGWAYGRAVLIEAGAIPPLVKFLDSAGENDRVQTGVVALNFLTVECPEN